MSFDQIIDAPLFSCSRHQAEGTGKRVLRPERASGCAPFSAVAGLGFKRNLKLLSFDFLIVQSIILTLNLLSYSAWMRQSAAEMGTKSRASFS
jgi:hypothetical protein